jgi:hypothetical protein
MTGPAAHSPIRPLLIALALGLLALAWPARSAAAGAERVDEPAAAVRDYWTPARMRGADPVEELAAPAEQGPRPLLGGAPASPRIGLFASEVPDPGAPGLRMHGRVFFTIPSGPRHGDYVCSGTAVNSPNQRAVWTAGHCAYESSGGGYVKNWTFVPAYEDGAAPYGKWPAKRLVASAQYRNQRDIRYDFAAAAVARNAAGEPLQEVVGARGIAFGQPRGQQLTAYGYPAEGTFMGNRREYRCDSAEQGGDHGLAEPRPMSIRCDMTGGSSGGGWIGPGGVLLSETSYGYADDPFTLYGPYLGGAAESLYEQVSHKRRPKRGKGGKGHRHGNRHELGSRHHRFH